MHSPKQWLSSTMTNVKSHVAAVCCNTILWTPIEWCVNFLARKCDQMPHANYRDQEKQMRKPTWYSWFCLRSISTSCRRAPILLRFCTGLFLIFLALAAYLQEHLNKRDRQTDRQKDTQTDTQTDGQTGMQTSSQMRCNNAVNGIHTLNKELAIPAQKNVQVHSPAQLSPAQPSTAQHWWLKQLSRHLQAELAALIRNTR